jgi:coproporphyrinogen III oxidase/oxygen-independent coproporphyrinogen-3 oxidase
MTPPELIAKYDIPAPRYTSYPTVPYWSENPTTEEWYSKIRESLAPKDSRIAIYIHLPFCETLCTFCGCHKSVTKNHSVEEPYIDNLLKEFSMYLENVDVMNQRDVTEIHLGGGSPTYFSEKNLENLLTKIISKLQISSNPVFSIEVDPRRTRKSQLEVLYKLGFRRISLGVQDFDLEVQRLINRNQPFEDTRRITEDARSLGYNSVNFDLLYGLPRQTEKSMADTLERTLVLKPDRLAFYGYAHVPWIKASQRLFTVEDLPLGAEKRKLYEQGRLEFEKAGYKEIGMDHFALPHDNLWKVSLEGKLHRNFMGYTENKTDLLLGLGVSAISDSWNCFHQNEKILKKYQKFISANSLPTFKGHKLTSQDLIQRKLILDLITKWEVVLPDSIDSTKALLQEMENDELISWDKNKLKIENKGRPFLRNICMSLDLRLIEKSPETRVFSSSI